MKPLTHSQVQSLYPTAYNAVPETYREDSGTKFFLDVNDHLCVEYHVGYASGDRVEESVWTGDRWVDV